MERKPKLQDKTNRIMEAPFNPKSALAAGASETETGAQCWDRPRS